MLEWILEDKSMLFEGFFCGGVIREPDVRAVLDCTILCPCEYCTLKGGRGKA